MRYIRYFCRFVLGVVFIFSGFVKVIDPLGSAYKFSDYFSAFSLDFLRDLALPLAILMSAFELVLGITIILGYRKKVAYWILLVFMSFFTILTFILAIFNPVTDCGCFGDALILTNWQTFFKNIILMIFVAILFEDRNRKYIAHGIVFEWTTILILFLSATFFSLWNVRHLPLVDFRPFDVGTDIELEMMIPEDAPVDEYETVLYYRDRGTGKKEGFTIKDYPRDTAAWEFLDSESKLVKKGYEPPIHDFAIISPYDEDATDEILSFRDYSLLMIAYDIEKADSGSLKKGNDWAGLEKIAGDFRFYPVTSSTQQQISAVKRGYALDYNFYSADEIMLKTVIRSNPGFVLIKNGIIIGKWGWRDFPAVSEIDPKWPDMITSASEPVNEERAWLLEEGIFDDLSFDVVEFDRPAMRMLSEDAERKNSNRIYFGFVMLTLLIISLLQIFVLIKKRKQ